MSRLELMRLYLMERYPEFGEGAAELYLSVCEKRGDLWIDRDYGFLNYEILGDALLIHDVFLEMGERSKKRAIEMCQEALTKAQEKNVSVIIGWSEKAGMHRDLGIHFMEQCEMRPFIDNHLKTFYIRAA